MNDKFCSTLLQAILPDEGNHQEAFSSLQKLTPAFVEVLTTLADAHRGAGHPVLFKYALWWLCSSVDMFKKEDAAKQLLCGSPVSRTTTTQQSTIAAQQQYKNTTSSTATIPQQQQPCS